MKIKNLKIRKKIASIALVGTIAGTALLTGCNKQVFDAKYKFNKAIVFDYAGGSATIIEIDSWTDYEDGEQFQIKTTDGLWIVTSSYDTKLINDENSIVSAEDFVRSVLGEDAVINYLNNETTKAR